MMEYSIGQNLFKEQSFAEAKLTSRETKMRTASFWLNHSESDSQAMVVFTLKNGKVRQHGIGFVNGNVVSLNSYMLCKRLAKDLLTSPYFPPPKPAS